MRGLQWFGLASTNQRRFCRFDCLIPVEIYQTTTGQISFMSAVARNISAGGMLLLCSQVLNPMARIQVTFQVPEWFPGSLCTRDVTTFADVRHVDPAGHLLGVAFNQPL